MKNNITISNRRASYDYEFISVYVSGIILTGTEIKSICDGKANLSDSYCFMENGELFAKNVYIDEYKSGSYNNHDPKRDRKLLLNRREIDKIEESIKIKGLSLIITKLFFNERGKVKLELALAKGKKQYEKRNSIQEKEMNRELDRVKKDY